MRESGALGTSRIFEQRACGPQCCVEVCSAEARQVMRSELAVERARRGIPLKVPGRQPPDGDPAALEPVDRGILRQQDFRRREALEFHAQVGRRRLHHGEAAGRQREPGKAQRFALRQDRHQDAVALVLQQGCVGEGAWRHDARDLALDRPARGAGIANLLADRDRLAQPHEAGEVLVDRVMRHTRHLDGFARRFTPAGQGDVEQARCPFGVAVEQLVEIAHAIEHQRVRVLGLDAQVLLHHGRMALDGLLHVDSVRQEDRAPVF